MTVYCILVLLFIVSEGHLDCDGTSTIHNTAIFVCFSIKYNYHLDCAGTFSTQKCHLFRQFFLCFTIKINITLLWIVPELFLHNSVHYSGNFCMFFY